MALLDIQATEGRPLALAATGLFALLCCTSMLRPLRDGLAVAQGAGRLPWLFSATLAAMVLAVPLFGSAASRLPRAALVAGAGAGSVIALLVFAVLDGRAAAAFFVWVSVFNLLAVSLAWSVVTDRFAPAQGRRLFGVLAAAGSAGALAGPALAAVLATRLGARPLTVVAAVLLAAATLALRAIASPSAVGGRALDGVWQTLRCARLGGTAMLLVCYTAVSTVLYMEQAALLAGVRDAAWRTALLARVDLAVNALTLVLQVAVSGPLMRRRALPAALGGVPLLVALGLLALALHPALGVLLAVSVVHRAGSHGLVRPAREVLFTALDADARYKARSFVETVLYRSGDAAGSWLTASLQAAGLGPGGVAAAAVPMALIWMATGVALGRLHERRREGSVAA